MNVLYKFRLGGVRCFAFVNSTAQMKFVIVTVAHVIVFSLGLVVSNQQAVKQGQVCHWI